MDGGRGVGPIDDPTVSFTPLMELAWPIAPTPRSLIPIVGE
jgi:hypothetical protein